MDESDQKPIEELLSALFGGKVTNLKDALEDANKRAEEIRRNTEDMKQFDVDTLAQVVAVQHGALKRLYEEVGFPLSILAEAAIHASGKILHASKCEVCKANMEKAKKEAAMQQEGGEVPPRAH
jgi:glutamine synthetase adenylyltransferase